MAKKKETSFKEQVFDELDKLPNLWRVKISQRSIRGTPDVLGVINTWPFAWELKKAANEKPDPLQQFELRRIEKAGGIARSVHQENLEYHLMELIGLAMKPRQQPSRRSKSRPC